jgi:hypothetical protein
MKKFRYELSELDETTGEWAKVSAAEAEPNIIAIGLRTMADLIDPPTTIGERAVADLMAPPPPTIGDFFRDVKNWFSEREGALTSAFNEGAKFRDPTHVPMPPACADCDGPFFCRRHGTAGEAVPTPKLKP